MNDPRTFLRGVLGYATMLAALRDQPMTTQELMAKLGLVSQTARSLMRQFHHRGLIHIVDWRLAGPRCTAVPVFTQGPGVDAALPPLKSGGLRVRRQPGPTPARVEMIAFVAIMRALETPHTAKSLIQLSGLHERTVYKLLRRMRSLRLIYVHSWDQTIAVAPIQLFQLGDKRNATRPKPRDKREVWRAHNAQRDARDRTLALIHLTAGSTPPARLPA